MLRSLPEKQSIQNAVLEQLPSSFETITRYCRSVSWALHPTNLSIQEGSSLTLWEMVWIAVLLSIF